MIQPNGPYNLLGLSSGGIQAHAVATCLEKSGERVDLLAMVDCYPIVNLLPAAYPDPNKDYQLLTVQWILKEFFSINTNEILEHPKTAGELLSAVVACGKLSAEDESFVVRVRDQ